MNDYFVYILLFVVALIYALLLNTKQGKSFATDNTWASVVIGTVIVLGAVWLLLPAGESLKVIIAFIVSGIPMVGRSLMNKARKSN